FVFTKQRPPHRHQVFHRMVKIQALPRLRKPIISQPPNPHGTVGNNQDSGGLSQTPPQCLGVQLLTERVDALARGDKTSLTDHGPSSSRLAAVIEPKTSGRINPVPA